MTVIGNSQSFDPSASGMMLGNLETFWIQGMDAVLVGIGRNITIHLPPSQIPCTSPTCVFNSIYKKFMNNDGTICRACAGQGFINESRQTIYKANIRWTEEPFSNAGASFNEPEQAGRRSINMVRTKTVLSSFDHIKTAVGATIDGINVELFEEPRPVGFVHTRYVVAVWKRVDR